MTDTRNYNHLEEDDQIEETCSNGHKSRVCPSCKGSGYIPPEFESQMVAIIPMSDSRLKPRRTFLWIFLTILICVILATIFAFFFYPRDIQFHVSPDTVINGTVLYANNATVPEKFELRMRLKLPYHIMNRNFYSVTINKLSIIISTTSDYFGNRENVAEEDISMTSSLSMKKTISDKVPINVTIKGNLGYFAYNFRIPFKLQVQTTIYGKQVGREFDVSVTDDIHFQCLK